MAGPSIGTWVKVKNKSGRMTARVLAKKFGGGEYEQGQVITQSEYQSFQKKRAEAIASESPSKTAAKTTTNPGKSVKVEVGLGRDLDGDAMVLRLSAKQASDPAVQSKLQEMKRIEGLNVRKNSDIKRYKEIVDEVFLAPQREATLSQFSGDERKKVEAAMGIFTRNFKANSKGQAVTSNDFVSLRNIDAGKPLRKKDQRKEFRDAAEGVNLLLSKGAKYDGAVYRGIDFWSGSQASSGGREKLRQDRDRFVAELRQKGEISLDAFSSFSTRPSVARQFAAGQGRDGTTSVVFRVKKNRSGVDVAPFSKVYEEAEVLVPKGTRYRVTNITEPKVEYGNNKGAYRMARTPKKDNIVYVDLEEI